MKKIIFLCLIFICICCSGSNLRLGNKNNISKEKSEDNAVAETKILEKKEVPLSEYVYLFFDRYVTEVKKKKNTAVNRNTKPVVMDINPDNYRVVVDWQAEDDRYIKMQNLKSGRIFIIKDGDKTGDSVLLERHLRYYIFKIGNTNVRIER